MPLPTRPRLNKRFGVRLVSLEPGAILSGWGERTYTNRPKMGDVCQAPVDVSREQLASAQRVR